MEIINASITPMEKVEILGISALFTPNRVSKATLHLNLFCYELQERQNQTCKVLVICLEAKTDFYGTILTPVPLLMTGTEELEIEANDLVASGQTYTLAQFEMLYNA